MLLFWCLQQCIVFYLLSWCMVVFLLWHEVDWSVMYWFSSSIICSYFSGMFYAFQADRKQMHRTRLSSAIGTTFHNFLVLCFTKVRTNWWTIKQSIDWWADEVRNLKETSARNPPLPHKQKKKMTRMSV
jgi:hypothetical protein